jgi:hypothetical protein
MTASRSVALVRRWVALYTIGLPRDIRETRRAEIEDDLWSQAHDVELDDPTGSGASGDVLARLVLGLWADITWRLEQRRRDWARPVPRSLSMSTRVVASLSIVGGTALAVASVLSGPFESASPVAILWRPLFVTGFAGLAIAIWGLVARFIDRMAGGVALLGALGGLGSAIAALGSAGAGDLLGAWFILLPIGSAAVALDLGRRGAMPRNLAIVHATAAFAVVVILLAIWSDSSLGALIYPRIPYALPWVPYALTWIGIGFSLVRGRPVVDQPSAIGRTPSDTSG